MKLLYGIQGTGNGHISRAKIIVPILKQFADVDVVMSGAHSELELPFPVNYRMYGFGFYFGKNGGIDITKTFRKTRLNKFVKEIRDFPVDQYDAVLNDFEPVSAWAAKREKVLSIGMSHQASLQFPNVPKPVKENFVGEMVLLNYAPADFQFGFHFQQYHKDIFLPLIRNDVRQAEPVNLGHYTVYLPSYSDQKIIKVLQQIPRVNWEVFSKHTKTGYESANVKINPVNGDEFLASMITAEGILCGAGFETPAEAIHLGKKLLVIPMKNQYEQQCNAEALRQMGVPVIKKMNKKQITAIRDWVDNPGIKFKPFEDQSYEVVKKVLSLIENINQTETELI